MWLLCIKPTPICLPVVCLPPFAPRLTVTAVVLKTTVAEGDEHFNLFAEVTIDGYEFKESIQWSVEEYEDPVWVSVRFVPTIQV